MQYVFIEQDDSGDEPVAIGPFDDEENARRAADGREVIALLTLTEWASSPQGQDGFTFVATHESVRDHSPAMLVSSDPAAGTVTLCNEEHEEWTDSASKWVALSTEATR